MISEYETIYHRPDLFSAYNLYRIPVQTPLEVHSCSAGQYIRGISWHTKIRGGFTRAHTCPSPEPYEILSTLSHPIL
jgi:hypothetical protein